MLFVNIDKLEASDDCSPLLRHDTQPCESEDCTPHDCTPPVVDPESIASAVVVTVCIFGAFVIGVIAWILN